MNAVEYIRPQDIKYPLSSHLIDKHNRILDIKFIVNYMSDGDPFDPKYTEICIDKFRFRGGETNQHIAIDDILKSIAILFGTRYTSVKMHIRKIATSDSNAPHAEEELSIDLTPYRIMESVNAKSNQT